MSSHEGADINSYFLTAEEVELKPLLAEAEDTLGLQSNGLAELEAFLSEAWFSGVRAGHAQMLERATQRKPPFGPIDMRSVEDEFRLLMESTADTLNLSVSRTILAWELLGRAWLSGTRSYQAEIAARLLEGESDVAQEALDWLEESGG